MTEPRVRKPAYRYFTSRPDQAGGLWRTMYAIEHQLSLASDYGEPAMVEFLRDLNPDLDESIGREIEQLIDHADTVDHAEKFWGYQVRDMWIDEYVAQLRKVAKLVRGIPAEPTRQRHVLGATP